MDNNKITTAVRARALVDEGRVYSGDWEPDYKGDDWDKAVISRYDVTCRCDEDDELDMVHACGPSNREKFLEVFEVNSYETAFIDDVLVQGVVQPLHIERLPYTNTLVLRNGHHRLAIAYKYNLMVPVRIVDYDDEIFGDPTWQNYDKLPYARPEWVDPDTIKS